MLNYIWAALIVSSLVFALATDVRDLAQDTYRNGEALPVEIVRPGGIDEVARRQPVEVRIDRQVFADFYGVDNPPHTLAFSGVLVSTREGREVRFDAEAALPSPLDVIRDQTNPRDQVLQGSVLSMRPAADSTAAATIVFAPVRFVKLTAISQAALDFAQTAVEIAIGLIGVLALFLGLMKIGEDAGVIRALEKVIRPLLRPLFPGIPKEHPAMGMIALNLSANVFGLGNAATPFGIKAMEELQTLNPSADTATDEMAMLLAINTASVQLVPPVLLIALLGLEINQVWFAIVITTLLSLMIAIAAAKILARWPVYRRSNPILRAEASGSAGDDEPPASHSPDEDA